MIGFMPKEKRSPERSCVPLWAHTMALKSSDGIGSSSSGADSVTASPVTATKFRLVRLNMTGTAGHTTHD